MNAFEVDPGRRARRCRVCDTLGHDRRNCPRLHGPVETTPEEVERIAAVARLRAELDAIGIETAEYTQVRAMVDARLSLNRRRAAEVLARIATMRGTTTKGGSL